jgi:hypothetical protein
MSLAEILSNKELKSIDQDQILVTHLNINNGSSNINHSIDSVGSYSITHKSGTKLLSFDADNNLDNCAVLVPINLAIGLTNGAIGALEAQSGIITDLQSKVDTLTLNLAQVSLYINAMKPFMADVKACIFIPDDSGQETNYFNLL